MFRDDEVKSEDEEEMIKKAAEKIHKWGMDTAGILMLETVKPLAYIGGQMGRLLISPFLILFGEGISRGGERFFTVFEKRENVEKLIQLLEEKMKEKDSEKSKTEKQVIKKTKSKKGWRRFFRF